MKGEVFATLAEEEFATPMVPALLPPPPPPPVAEPTSGTTGTPRPRSRSSTRWEKTLGGTRVPEGRPPQDVVAVEGSGE